MATDYDKIADFLTLYDAFKASRSGKKYKTEVMEFENDLEYNLFKMEEYLQKGLYKLGGYYSFDIYEPKRRTVHAAHFRDRVLYHAICDNVLEPKLQPRLIHANAACQKGKGTHFAIKMVRQFMVAHYKSVRPHNKCGEGGNLGYVLKCDVRKYFNNIDHAVLKLKLDKVPLDTKTRALLDLIIDSYYDVDRGPDKGLPLGNQTSQWFAIFYLDSVDRLIKERLQIKYYSRYMDDLILIHEDKAVLEQALVAITAACKEIGLELNEKTQIIPLNSGFSYLGWRFTYGANGRIIQRVSSQSKIRYYKKMNELLWNFKHQKTDLKHVQTVFASYKGHLSSGDGYAVFKNGVDMFGIIRNPEGDYSKYRRTGKEFASLTHYCAKALDPRVKPEDDRVVTHWNDTDDRRTGSIAPARPSFPARVAGSTPTVDRVGPAINVGKWGGKL